MAHCAVDCALFLTRQSGALLVSASLRACPWHCCLHEAIKERITRLENILR